MAEQTKQKDNTTYSDKVTIRKLAMHEVSDPIVMECYGGFGHLYRACYSSARTGVVFESKSEKCAVLGLQRPHWAVYQAECVNALTNGAGAHLCVNVLDLDPYGEPWPALDAFMSTERPRAPRLALVVNDGLRQKIRMGGAWNVHSLRDVVSKYGNDLHDHYLEICRELVQTKAAQAGYRLDRFAGKYCGHAQQMTHYLAVLVLNDAAAPA